MKFGTFNPDQEVGIETDKGAVVGQLEFLCDGLGQFWITGMWL